MCAELTSPPYRLPFIGLINASPSLSHKLLNFFLPFFPFLSLSLSLCLLFPLSCPTSLPCVLPATCSVSHSFSISLRPLPQPPTVFVRLRWPCLSPFSPLYPLCIPQDTCPRVSKSACFCVLLCLAHSFSPSPSGYFSSICDLLPLLAPILVSSVLITLATLHFPYISLSFVFPLHLRGCFSCTHNSAIHACSTSLKVILSFLSFIYYSSLLLFFMSFSLSLSRPLAMPYVPSWLSHVSFHLFASIHLPQHTHTHTHVLYTFPLSHQHLEAYVVKPLILSPNQVPNSFMESHKILPQFSISCHRLSLRLEISACELSVKPQISTDKPSGTP